MIVAIDYSVNKARNATYLMFLICGIAVSSWAPMVPLAKQRTGLNEAGLGLILLCMGGGAILSMPFVGPLIQHIGSRMIILFTAIAAAATLPFLTIADTPFTLGVTLFIFGAALGCLDVAMNSQAVIVQDRMTRPVMSSFHGMFSLGGLFGAMIFGVFLFAGLSPFVSACVIAITLLIIAFTQFRYFLDHPEREEGKKSFMLKLPRGPVILLGAFCLITFLTEGALLDWSALFLRENRGFSVAMTGAGYGVFSVAMALMRFTGDRLVHKYGPDKIVLWGAGLAAIGLLIAVLTTWLATVLAGFLFIGIGAANVVPVIFSAAGKADKHAPELGLAAVTTMGYAGQLAGPALIGFIANSSSLPVALGMMAGPMMLVSLTFSYGQRKASAGA
ncbi:MAG TPA: MFS transporter [Flavitalea sp.]|nr:MFS transporter [Flavitalea sp.]